MTAQQPDQAIERRDTTSAGRGWLIQCADCGRTYLVTREEIMSGSWLHKRCPHCAGCDGKEAA